MQATPHEIGKEDSSGNGPPDLGHSSSFPQELIDLIIDTVSDDRHDQRTLYARNLALRTLCVFALVSRSWTGRAQRRIFESADICGPRHLYSFAEALRGSPQLAAVVQRLAITQRIESLKNFDSSTSKHHYLPNGAEGLFPTVLAGLLPNLRSLAFDSRLWNLVYKPRDRRATATMGQISQVIRVHVPIHHRFPLLLSSSGFSDLRELHFAAIVFHTFNDFARMLHVFTRLQVLHCGDVDWITLGVILPPFMTPAGAARRNGQFLPVLETLSVCTVGRHGVERLLSGLALNASLRTLTYSLPVYKNLNPMDPSVDPATGMSDGINLSLFPHLSGLVILDIIPESSRSAQRAVLAVLHKLLASWSDDPPSRTLTLGIKPVPRGNRFYTKQNYMRFLDELGKSVEEACTHRRGSSIPALHARLEIPQDATTTLEELEREAGPCFPMAFNAGKLTVEAHTSESYDYSWKTTVVDEARTATAR